MFKRHPSEISELLRSFLRANGLETPWLQHRLLEQWDVVAGETVSQYTEEKQIRNQTLWVKISSPAMRSELQMRRTALTQQLNDSVGAQIITDIRVY